MTFPLGVVACPALLSAEESIDHKTTFGRSSREISASNLSLVSGERLSSVLSFRKSPTKQSTSLAGSTTHSSSRFRTFASFRKRGRGVCAGVSATPESATTSELSDLSYPPNDTLDAPGSPHDSIISRNDNSLRTFSAVGRPKHIPILVPSHSAQSPGDASHAGSVIGSFDDTKQLHEQRQSSFHKYSCDIAFSEPQRVELNPPIWSLSVPHLSRNAISIPTKEFVQVGRHASDLDSNLGTSSSHIQQHSSLPVAPYAMADPIRPSASQERFHASRMNNGSSANLTYNGLVSHGSFSSLGTDRDSASEAESVSQDVMSSSRRAEGSFTPQAYSSNNTQLSGLVCNVHRTTGKEPPPLVGATTTILGDKLYVFGGRRVSRTKSQLTSTIYELDLVRRHWSKLAVKGDIPSPRYFHSVCALGDTKLVCYGGMSPTTPEAPPESQPEVAVMSDVHIFDVATLTWTKIVTTDAPQGRYAHCAAILPSAAVFASATAPLSAIHHNPAGANPNSGSLGTSLDGTGGAEMVIVGGQDSGNHYIEQVSVFNLRSLKWTGTTGMGRSCGAYRSVVTPLTTMKATQIGAGPQAQLEDDHDDDEEVNGPIGSGSPMLIYSNYNFLDVKLELQIRLTDGTLTEKTMQTSVSPPGLRFPNGGVIANHFVVSGTFLTSTKQEYALWALDLTTLMWSKIDAGGSIFSTGSWNRGLLWSRRNAFVILGNRKRSLVDDYNNRRINFSNMCVVELEAFGLYENPKVAEPTSDFQSASTGPKTPSSEPTGRVLSSAAEELGLMCMGFKELADMEFLSIDNTRIPVSSRMIARRWGTHFVALLRESLAATNDPDTATLRPTFSNHPSRNSSITITPSLDSTATTLVSNTNGLPDALDLRGTYPAARPRIFYLPHTTPTIHALLYYLYTATLPAAGHAFNTPQILCSLLQLARPYKIDGLLEAVVERLHECLNGPNAAAIFNAAAMGAGGGQSLNANNVNQDPQASIRNPHRIHQSNIPPRTASLAGLDSLVSNGISGGRTSAIIRIDTTIANDKSASRTGLRRQHDHSRSGADDDTEDDDDRPPDSAATDTSSFSDADFAISPSSLTARSSRERGNREVWNGSLSAVVGLQKRGLRGLMEGRRMRERSRNDSAGAHENAIGGAVEGVRGLGIA